MLNLKTKSMHINSENIVFKFQKFGKFVAIKV